jgi:diguanylate cyclase (GGDEF)-like protein
MTADQRAMHESLAQAKHAVEEQERRFNVVLDNLPHGFCMFDAHTRLIVCNAAYAKMYALPAALTAAGTPLEDILAHRSAIGNAPADMSSYFDVISIAKAKKTYAVTNIELKDGRTIRVTHNPMADDGYVTTHEDITEIVQAKQRASELAEEAEAEQRKLQAALSNMPNGLCMFDADLRLILSNARYAEMYDLPAHLLKPGTPLQSIVDYRHKIGNGPKDFPDYVTHHKPDAVEGANVCVQFELEDGRTIRINRLCLSGGGYVASHEDITDAVRAETWIGHLATHDALTNLPNRALFRDRLTAVLRGSAEDRRIAVLCLNLDRFKSINDTLGHPVGDALLSVVAERLRNCVAKTDMVARLGDDGFAILQLGQDQPSGSTELAQAIVEALNEPHDLNGHHLTIAASIGIALAPEDGSDADRLLKNANIAIDRAKSDGGGSYCFFEPAMDAKMQRRRSLELGLRRALDNGEFELHYQPLVNLENRRVTGFEALLRWREPQGKLVSPAEFIPFAEESRLIMPIGDWVIRQACADAVNWPDNLRVAVNLSAVQFRDDHVTHVILGALAASGLAASRLEIEITESVLLRNSKDTLATLHRLRGFGVKISMDDFGTGYSSLSYLRSFPFDKIKIDQSFIRDLPESEDSKAIVRAVSGLGASLGIATIGEGVETLEQLNLLRASGCTEAQGYLLGRPRPLAELEHLLRDPAWPERVAA